MKKEVSSPPCEAVDWTVTLLADRSVQKTVRARTAWAAHVEAKLGPFSAVECKIIVPKAPGSKSNGNGGHGPLFGRPW